MPREDQWLLQMVTAEGLSSPAKEANDVCFRRCVTNFKTESNLEMGMSSLPFPSLPSSLPPQPQRILHAGEKTCVSRCTRKYFEAYVATMEKREALNDMVRSRTYPPVELIWGPTAQ